MPRHGENELKRKLREETTQTTSTAQTNKKSTTEEMEYVNRYPKGKFSTFVPLAPTSDDAELNAEDLLALASADEEELEEAAAKKRDENKPKPRMLIGKKEIAAALSGKIDHHYTDKKSFGDVKIEIGGGLRKNNYPTMLAQYDVAKFSLFQELDDSDIHTIEWDTMRELQMQFAKNENFDGTTVISVTIDFVRQIIVTTQLGNMSAVLHWVDREDKDHVLLLQDSTHVRGDALETKRLSDAGHKNHKKTSINVTRMLGANQLTPRGLLHTPTVSIKSYREIAQSAKQVRVLVVNEDFFVPNQHLNPDAIKTTLSAWENKTTVTLLTKQLLTMTARHMNNSVLLLAEFPTAPIAKPQINSGKSAMSLTLCHGVQSSRVAELVARNYQPIKQDCINDHLKSVKPHLVTPELQRTISISGSGSTTIEMSQPAQVAETATAGNGVQQAQKTRAGSPFWSGKTPASPEHPGSPSSLEHVGFPSFQPAQPLDYPSYPSSDAADEEVANINADASSPVI